MDVEYYLRKFEDVATNGRTPLEPPAFSALYWRNTSENKFKVSIPTDKRELYYNLEVYDDSVVKNQHITDKWRDANMCLNLAVSEEFAADKLVIDQMEHVIKMFENLTPTASTSGNSKYYVLMKYFVKDIVNIPKDQRYVYSKFTTRITLSPEHDQDLINAINTAFQLSAERFSNDENREVIAYSRQQN